MITKTLRLVRARFGRLALVMTAAVAFTSLAVPARAQFLCQGYGTVVDLVWDGYRGTLYLNPTAAGANGPASPSYLMFNGRSYQVSSWRAGLNPQDNAGGQHGPGYKGVPSYLGHRLYFQVDFQNTPLNNADDQKFDGYVLTQTQREVAGITWYGQVPFGFYGTNSRCNLPRVP